MKSLLRGEDAKGKKEGRKGDKKRRIEKRSEKLKHSQCSLAKRNQHRKECVDQWISK